MNRILTLTIALVLTAAAAAQPARRRAVQPVQTQTPTAQAERRSDRAALMFPTSASMPEDVVWRRDIYRQLDLTQDANAPLYYPVTPSGKNQNLFTYLFRLVLSGRITAYQYKLDGNESFEEADKAEVKELMERYYITYEERDGRLVVEPSDIPSAEVTRFYIKETSYFDQRSATYKARVTALCPVLMSGADEFGTEATPYPLFWVKYDDVATYLSRLPLMASNLNNVTNMTADDYFTLNRYQGKIYKTNNMQGRVLPKDSTGVAEQQRIEQQLHDFEQGIWHQPAVQQAVADNATAQGSGSTVAADSTQAASVQPARPAKAKKTKENNRRAASSAAAASSKPQRASSSSAPRASARRQRR